MSATAPGKTVGTTIVILIGLALALGGGYWLGRGSHDHDAQTAGTGGEIVKVQYTCSMHPFIIRDAPGACPICGGGRSSAWTTWAGRMPDG